jgi:hypothetical protein
LSDGGSRSEQDVSTFAPSQLHKNVHEEPSPNWSTYVPAQLKTPKNKRLCTPNENLSAKRTRFSSKLINEKIAFVQLQKEKFLEEHALKIDILHLKKKILLKQLSE